MNRSDIFSTEAWRASIFASASASLVGLRERLRVRLLFFAFFGDFFGDFFGERERLRERLRERQPDRRRLFLVEPLEPFWEGSPCRIRPYRSLPSPGRTRSSSRCRDRCCCCSCCFRRRHHHCLLLCRRSETCAWTACAASSSECGSSSRDFRRCSCRRRMNLYLVYQDFASRGGS